MASQSFRVKNSLEVGTGVTITSGGNITAGVVTATSFVGSGSQLTQIVVSTVVGGAISATSLSVTGVSTFDGAVKIRNGYNLNIGDNNDLRIYNDGENSRIQETGSGTFYISGSDINIQQDSTNKNFARFVGGGAAELYYNDSKKFETSGIGITVTGTINSNQINVSGVVTASSFSGNASSATYATSAGIATYSTSSGIATYATSAGIATYSTSSGIATYATSAGTAYGLTGSPNITVGNITGTGATFTNLTVNGTQTIINTTSLEVADKNIGIGSTSTPSDALVDGAGITIYGTTNKTLTYNNTKKALETNVAWATTETRFISVAEKLTRIDGNTVALAYSTTGSNIGFATNPSGDITLAVTGIPTSSDFDNHVLTFSIFVSQTGTARSCTAVTLNGVSETINWAGGSLAAAISGVTTSIGIDIYSFTGINTVGSASTAANYQVLGVVNGGFR